MQLQQAVVEAAGWCLVEYLLAHPLEALLQLRLQQAVEEVAARALRAQQQRYRRRQSGGEAVAIITLQQQAAEAALAVECQKTT